MRIAIGLVVLGLVGACTSTAPDPFTRDSSPNLPSGNTTAPPSSPTIPAQPPPHGEANGSAPPTATSAPPTAPPPPPPSDDAGAPPPPPPTTDDAGAPPPPPTDDAGAPPPPPPPPPPLAECNAVVQSGAEVTMVDRVATYDRTQLTGGVIADGTYVLSAVTRYVEPSHVDGAMRPYGHDTVVVHGGAIDDVLLEDEDGSGAIARFSGTLTATASRLQLTTSCMWPAGTNLPATGDWNELAHDDNSFGATPTSFTVWTMRGNHESVVRVFTRLP